MTTIKFKKSKKLKVGEKGPLVPLVFPEAKIVNIGTSRGLILSKSVLDRFHLGTGDKVIPCLYIKQWTLKDECSDRELFLFEQWKHQKAKDDQEIREATKRLKKHRL